MNKPKANFGQTKVPYIMTANKVSLVIDNRQRVVDKSHVNYDKLVVELKKQTHNIQAIRDMVDIPSFLARQTFGRVQVGTTPAGSWGVIFDGEEMTNSVLVDRLIDMATDGEDVEPVARFLDSVMDNPLESARKELFEWLGNGDTPAPFLQDGRFLAYKMVRSDYKDIHSGTILNAVGTTVEMPREQVDPDRTRTCSVGLHFCSYSYLDAAYSRTKDKRCLILAINPADVVAIPNDYKFQKGRTWRYEVVGEVPADEQPKDYDLRGFAKNHDASVTAGTAATGATVTKAESDTAADEPEQQVAAKPKKRKGWKKLSFTVQNTGANYGAEAILSGVKAQGQRGYANEIGVARSTLQGWLTAIQKAKGG